MLLWVHLLMISLELIVPVSVSFLFETTITLTVHHSDYDPSNNHPSNLIALCSACHLHKHREKRGNMSIGSIKIRFRNRLLTALLKTSI